MLSYLLNIYVIIGIFGALLAIIFSKYLTKPLVLLQESLAAINIDKHNEKIQWNKNDEIGQLINEYNLMVDKLEQSTELLKHSEREKALLQMAATIGHNLNNPLGSLKLFIADIKSELEESSEKKYSEDFELIEEAIKRISDLAKDLSRLKDPTTENYTSDAKMIKLN
jgi:signal transduction histidine kinase